MAFIERQSISLPVPGKLPMAVSDKDIACAMSCHRDVRDCRLSVGTRWDSIPDWLLAVLKRAVPRVCCRSSGKVADVGCRDGE